MKINKSQLTRELGKDLCIIHKYSNGFVKSKTQTRSSNLDEYYDIIRELLSESSQQIFYCRSMNSVGEKK